MADLLQQGAEWLGRMRATHLARIVAYQRGERQVQIAATVGTSVFQIDDGYGGIEKWQSRDYLIRAADLVLDGMPTRPQRGDRISDGGALYEVMAPGKEDVFQNSDPYGVSLRIHTKQVV